MTHENYVTLPKGATITMPEDGRLLRAAPTFPTVHVANVRMLDGEKFVLLANADDGRIKLEPVSAD